MNYLRDMREAITGQLGPYLRLVAVLHVLAILMLAAMLYALLLLG